MIDGFAQGELFSAFNSILHFSRQDRLGVLRVLPEHEPRLLRTRRSRTLRPILEAMLLR
jgi:hypothetical protein